MQTACQTPLEFTVCGIFLWFYFLKKTKTPPKTKSKAATVSFCSGFQVLVLGNKRDLPNALDEKQLIEKM